MDIIFIEQLTVMMVIGIHNWEKQLLQKLIFDLEMGWDNHIAVRSNSISDCLNYDDVNKAILSLIHEKKFSLLESVAEETAARLIEQFHLPWIRVKLSKPGAITHAANVGVIIERTK